MQLDILYRNDVLLVINKPAGMLAQEDQTGDLDVVRQLKLQLANADTTEPFVGLVHRLDRPASGLMVLALSSEAASNLSAQFREHHPEKGYLALVEGSLSGMGRFEDYLAKEKRGTKVVEPDHPDGKLARLNWQCIAQAGGLSLIHIQLQTGRSHQIRVQFAHRGRPILGDFRYGATRELDGRNLALHAYKLSLEHPSRRTGMQWTAAPPDTWPSKYQSAIQPFLSS